MDEILYSGPEPQAEAGVDELTARAERRELLRRRWEEISYRVDRFFSRNRLNPGIFLLAALLIAALGIFTTVYTRGYAVAVDGRELGVVADTAAIDAVVERVEARASRILKSDYTLPCEVSYTPRYVERNQITALSGFETYLFNQVGEIMKTYTVTVNGRMLGTLEHRDELDALLDSIKAPYVTENTISSDFTIPIQVDYGYTSSDELTTVASFRDLLLSNSIEEVTYTVVAGDTYSGIAYRHDMKLDELMGMNPQASLERLYPGDELVVRQSVPYLSVKTVDRLTYEAPVECPIEYVEDSKLYTGDTKVIDPGVEGLAMVTADVTYINGEEESRNVIESQELVAPTTRIIATGTAPRPKTAPKGYFIWPCRGTITSYFGYRSIFGSYSYHQGLDIGVPYYTTIKAADGGTVIWAGAKGSYGNLVIIDHGNGKTSYYGHNSSLLVRYGEKVYQGQAIAKAGSTGNSTGPHCHFEVRLNGTPVNPLKYL